MKFMIADIADKIRSLDSMKKTLLKRTMVCAEFGIVEGVLFPPAHRFIDIPAFSRMPEAAGASLLVSTAMISEHVFQSRTGQPMTRFGVQDIVTRYARTGKTRCPGLREKYVSPHTIRHTTASHCCGPEPTSTQSARGSDIYAESDVEMKAKPLQCARHHRGEMESASGMIPIC